MIYLPVREAVTMLHNVNVKKEHQKSSHRLMPLSIDHIEEFTYDDAVNQFERAKKAGWPIAQGGTA